MQLWIRITYVIVYNFYLIVFDFELTCCLLKPMSRSSLALKADRKWRHESSSMTYINAGHWVGYGRLLMEVV